MRVSKAHLRVLGALALIALCWPVSTAEAYGGSCRDYTKKSLLNGRLEISVAQACRDHGDRWEIVDLRGPVEMRDYMLGMIHRDLYAINSRYVIINSPGYYYSPAPQRVVVYQQPQRVYVQKYPHYNRNVYYYKTKDKRHDDRRDDHRHDNRDSHRHDNRNDRNDWDRGNNGRGNNDHDRGNNGRGNNDNNDRKGTGMGSWR